MRAVTKTTKKSKEDHLKTQCDCDAERFVHGLRKLFEDCHVKTYSLAKTTFKDESSIGNMFAAKFALHIIDKLS